VRVRVVGVAVMLRGSGGHNAGGAGIDELGTTGGACHGVHAASHSRHTPTARRVHLLRELLEKWRISGVALRVDFALA
jgi:hypothetical protein